jgi:hypothetical protein
MRTRALIVLAVAALALSGCGDHNLVLKVDVLSYLDPALRAVAFGPVPVAPGGLATGEQALVDDETINLLDGLNSVAEVHSVTIGLAAFAHDSTGSGSDTLRIYASDENTDPRSTPPVAELVVALTAGRDTTVDVTVPADSRVAELFVRRKMRLSVTTSLRGPESGDPLNGRVALRTLEAIVIAGRKAF